MAETLFELRLVNYSRFIAVVTIAHVATYIIAGMLAYFFIYESVIATGGFDDYMRNPNNPEEWQHVLTWMIPAEVLRGILFGIALCPFLKTLSEWKISFRFITIFFMLLVFSVWSVTMPASGSIEGWVYLLPDSSPILPNPMLGYLEVPLQLAAFSFLVSWRIGKQIKT